MTFSVAVLNPILSGLTNEGGWNWLQFIANFITFPVYLILYFGYKFVNKTKFVPLNEVDLTTDNINFSGQEYYEDEAPKTGWRKVLAFLV